MKRILAVGILALLPAVLRGAPSESPARTFRIEDAWGRDTVEFRTSAPIEEIVGTTNRVTGEVTADPSQLRGRPATARIEVLLSSIRTGVGMRDRQVAKALGAAKHPKAVFTLDGIRSASENVLRPNSAVEVAGSGSLELNGMRRPLPFKARITYVPSGGPFSRMRPGNFVKIVAEFDVNLDDFGVERRGPVLELQVAPTAHVTVTVLASDASPAEAAGYRETAVQYLGKAVN